MIRRIGEVPNYMDVVKELNYETLRSTFQGDLWRNTSDGSAHKDTDSIFLRMGDLIYPSDVFNEIDSYTCQVLADSPKVMDVISDCMRLVRASRVGRVMLVNLRPGGVITPHKDQGDYCKAFRRFHLPILTNPGVSFTCGEDTEYMEPGVLYEIDNRLEHSVRNNSSEGRVHLIIDMQLMENWIRITRPEEDVGQISLKLE